MTLRCAALAAALLLGCGGGESSPDAAPDAPGAPDAMPIIVDAGPDVIVPECVIAQGHMGAPVINGFAPDHVCRGGKIFIVGDNILGSCAMLADRSMFIAYEGDDMIASFRIPEDMAPVNDLFIVMNELGSGQSPFVLTVQAGHIPVLDGLAPSMAAAASPVTITGTNLLGAGITVTLSDDVTTANATVTDDTDTSLTFTVPFVTPGFYKVTVAVPDCGDATFAAPLQVI